MSTVRVYRSTDTGAPAHPSDIRGSMAALLRACLVTGYDVQPAAGWEEPFPETNNYACFRALSGVRKFLQIDDNQTYDVTAATSFDSMSDAVSGAGNRGSCRFGKRDYGTDAYSTEWFLIADEKTFYVFLNTQYGLIPHGFGEFYSYLGSDSLKSFLSGHTDDRGLPDYYNSVPAMLSTGMITQTGLQYPLHLASSLFDVNKCEACIVGTAGAYGANHSSSSDDFYSSISAGVDYPVFSARLSVSSPVVEKAFRGHLHGVYFPAAFTPKLHASTFVYNGTTFIALNCGNASNSYANNQQMWLDISGSWEESL